MSYYKYLEIRATIDPDLCYSEYLPKTARLRYYKNMRRKGRKQNCCNRFFQETSAIDFIPLDKKL